LGENWSRELHTALDEKLDFSTRAAAAESIWNYRRAIHLGFQDSSGDIAVSFNIGTALAKALVDDDDEIRDLAAKTVSYIVSSPFEYGNKTSRTYQLHPIAARISLNNILSKKFSDSHLISHIGLCFILGFPVWSLWPMLKEPQSSSKRNTSCPLPILNTISAAEFFEQSLIENNTLFTKERQNLFIDEVEEAKAWVIVLERHRTAVSEKVVSALQDWLRGGIKACTKYTQTHYDGPLGWSTKRNVFVVGMRLLLFAQLLLAWLDSPVHKEELIKQLEQLYEVGWKKDLNKHWMRRIEQMLDAEQDRKLVSAL